MITCPEHGLELEIQGKFLRVNGKTKNIVIGRCPKCKVIYVNQELSSNPEYKVGGKTYKFLPALNSQYRPQEIIALTPHDYPRKKHPIDKTEQTETHESKKVYVLQRIPILDSPDDNCMFCEKPLHSTVHVRYPVHSPDGTTKEYECILWECPDCRAVFASYSQMRKIREGKYKDHIETVRASSFLTAAQMMEVASQQKIQQKKTGEDRIDRALKNWPSTTQKQPDQSLRSHYDNLSQGNHIVWVYAQKCHCQKCEKKFSVDTIENRTALINTVNGEVLASGEIRHLGSGRNRQSESKRKSHYKLLSKPLY